MSNSGKRFGVIVGISDYSHVAENNNLRFTVNDAERLYSVLRSRVGFAEENLRLLVDAPSEKFKPVAQIPSRSNILAAVSHFAETATPDDLLLVFFAGHGFDIGSHPYLLSYDTRMDLVRDTAVNISTLNSFLDQSRAQCTLRIFDVCRSGYGARLLNSAMSRSLEQALLKSPKGGGAFSACSAGECAFEHPDLKQSVFTYYLCEGLEGLAANGEGIVTWERLIDYVKISVANFCKTQSWQQTPQARSEIFGTLGLAAAEAGSQQPPPGRLPAAQPGTKTLHLELRALIDDHLAQVTESVRRFQLTTKEETPEIGELLHAALLGQLADFSHRSMNIHVFDLKGFHTLGGPRADLQKTLESAMALEDFCKDGYWLSVAFESTELTIPTSKLTVAVIRFRFFYWIWFRHECIPNQQSLAYQPNPPEIIGYYTFSPASALDVPTIEGTIQQILQDSFQRIAQWAEQTRNGCADWVQRVSKLSHLAS